MKMTETEISIAKLKNIHTVKIYTVGMHKEYLGILVFYDDGKRRTLNISSNEPYFENLMAKLLELYPVEKNKIQFIDSKTRKILENGLSLERLIPDFHFNNKMYSKTNDFTDIEHIKPIIFSVLKRIGELAGDDIKFNSLSGFRTRFVLNISRNNNLEEIPFIYIKESQNTYQLCLNNVFNFPLYMKIRFLENRFTIDWVCPKRLLSYYQSYSFNQENVQFEEELTFDGKLHYYNKKDENYGQLDEVLPIHQISTLGEPYKFFKFFDGFYCLNYLNNDSVTRKTKYILTSETSLMTKEMGSKSYIQNGLNIKVNEYGIESFVSLYDGYGIIQFNYQKLVSALGNYKRDLAGRTSYSGFLTNCKSLKEIKDFNLIPLTDINAIYDDIYDSISFKKRLEKK